MYRQPLPLAAYRYSTDRTREIASAVSAVRRQWARMGGDLDASWRRVGPSMLAVTSMAQRRVAGLAAAYIPAVIGSLGMSAPAEVETDWSPLVGVAGDGRDVESLLYGAVVDARTRMSEGESRFQAMDSASTWLTMATSSLLSDTARAVESLGIGARPRVRVYVRMLVSPSCSRCVVLAGRTYRSGTAFQRHPHCDCVHVPTAESMAGDLAVDPMEYFRSLSDIEANRVFTKAGAEAIRSGADISQVVNARRGMATAGKSITTTRGTWVRTKNGDLVWQERTVNVQRRTAAGGTTREGMSRSGIARSVRQNNAPRLMPETIAEMATSREDYLRLLRVNGYLF